MNDTVSRDSAEDMPATRGVIAQTLARLDRLMRRLRGSEEPARLPPTDVVLSRPYPWEANYPDGLGWDHDLPERPLFALLEDVSEHARRQSDLWPVYRDGVVQRQCVDLSVES